MTASQNVESRRDRNQTAVQLPVTTNLTVNAGDLCYWDGTNYTVTPITNESQLSGSNYLGAALQANANVIYPGDPDKWGLLVLLRGAIWVNTTAGDTYNWFDSVTIGADAQTVTKVGQTTNNTVGYILPVEQYLTTPRANQATPTPETFAGGSGLRVLMQLVPNHKYAAAV